MVLPHTITMFNKTRNGYVSTVIRGVLYDAKRSYNDTTEGNTDTTNIKVIIPKSAKADDYKEYAKPTEFEANENNKWTVRKGDFLIKGEQSKDIENIKYSTIKDAYDDVLKINSVRDIDYGDISLHHFIVEGS